MKAKSIQKIRKLQHIGGQYLLNIPRSLKDRMQWERGDYLSVVQVERDVLQIRKVAPAYLTRAQAMLPQIRQEAMQAIGLLFTDQKVMDPTTFSHHLARVSHLIAQTRKHALKSGN